MKALLVWSESEDVGDKHREEGEWKQDRRELQQPPARADAAAEGVEAGRDETEEVGFIHKIRKIVKS